MDKRKDQHQSNEVTQSEKIYLSVLRRDLDLWYRLHVLLYDLSNVASDTLSDQRICSTINELYLSEPYFNDDEAIRIRTAIVDSIFEGADKTTDTNIDLIPEFKVEETASAPMPDGTSTANKDTTVEEVIHSRLSGFFEKRKASGDARPCGPHDMLPVYLSTFDVDKEALKDERFLSRLRRSGLGDRGSKEHKSADDYSKKRGKGKKKDNKKG